MKICLSENCSLASCLKGVPDRYSVYLNYGFAYIVALDGILRLCGLFNEPGYFGTILALVLCIEQLDLQKKENVAFLLAGCCTASVAFFLIIGLYTIMAKIHNYKYIIPLVCLFLFFFFLLPHINFSNPTIQRLIERLYFTDGQFVGDNRSDKIIDLYYYNVLGSPEKIMWGYGNGFSSILMTKTSTYKSYIINYGLIGFVLIYAPLLIESLRKSQMNKLCIFLIICFFVSIYQRPNIYTLPYFVVLFGGITYLNECIFIKNKLVQNGTLI